MKHLVQINVIACERATAFNQETKQKESKSTKDGRPVFNLSYLQKGVKKVGEIEVEETQVCRISSLLELKPGQHMLKVEIFSVNGKIYPRAIAEIKGGK